MKPHARAPHAAISAVLVIAAAAAGMSACRGGADEGPVRASGYVEATEVRVAAEVGGRILELAIEEGDRIAAGAIVARLDTADTDLALQRAGAERAQADAQLALLEAGARARGRPPGRRPGGVGPRRRRRRRGGAPRGRRRSRAVRRAARLECRIAQAARRRGDQARGGGGARQRRAGAGARRGRGRRTAARRRAAARKWPRHESRIDAVDAQIAALKKARPTRP